MPAVSLRRHRYWITVENEKPVLMVPMRCIPRDFRGELNHEVASRHLVQRNECHSAEVELTGPELPHRVLRVSPNCTSMGVGLRPL